MTRKMALKSIFILFCAFQVYQNQNVSSSKINAFKVDDFINQLMTSKRFSELTDIIAEKAAKKIRLFQQDKKEQSSEKEFRNKDETQTEIPESETLEENKNVKSRKGASTTKFGKINTDAFLKQDLKSGEILLNYKHMTAELKRNDHKTNTQKNGENLSDRDRGTRSDRDSKMNRDRGTRSDHDSKMNRDRETRSDHDSKMNRDTHSEKPKYQSKEPKIQPRKQLKTNKIYEEIERNFNKMNKSMTQDSSSAEIKYENVNNTINKASEEAFEEHEIFIKTDVDGVPKLNVKKGPNSNENLDKYANPDEKNEVDTKSIKNPTNIDENIEKITKAVKIPKISKKELDKHDKSIKNNESMNNQENTNEKFEQNVMESSQKSIETKHDLNKKSPKYFNKNFKKISKTIKYQENTHEKLEIRSTPIQDLIEMQNQPKQQKIDLKKIGNMQNGNRPKLQKGTPKSRTQKFKADQTTEHVEDYSDVLSFEGAKATLLKEPILAHPIIRRENGKIYKLNYSEPDYKDYHDKLVSKGNFIQLE